MTLYAEAKCPHCKNDQYVTVAQSIGKEIVLCCPEGGGCDKYYVVFYKATATADCYKIEGLEQEAAA